MITNVIRLSDYIVTGKTVVEWYKKGTLLLVYTTIRFVCCIAAAVLCSCVYLSMVVCIVCVSETRVNRQAQMRNRSTELGVTL